MGKLISALLKWALFLGITDGLVHVTCALYHNAAHTQAIELVSLSRLNHQLLERPKPKHVRKR